MQARTAAVERHANLASRQPRQLIERTRLGRAGVGGREDAQPRGTLALRARGRDLLQHVLQLADTGHRDEADQDVHLIGRGQLAPDLLKQRWRALAGREQPGCRETDLGRCVELAITLHGTQHTQWMRYQVDNFGGTAFCARAFCRGEPVPKHHQQLVDQLELPPGSVGVITGNFLQDRAELARDDIDQKLGRSALERQHLGAARVEGGERSSQALGEQQIVETVRQRHRVSGLQPIDRVPRQAG